MNFDDNKAVSERFYALTMLLSVQKIIKEKLILKQKKRKLWALKYTGL
jgi:hypothetical protein